MGGGHSQKCKVRFGYTLLKHPILEVTPTWASTLVTFLPFRRFWIFTYMKIEIFFVPKENFPFSIPDIKKLL
jgi:hypothetical protein